MLKSIVKLGAAGLLAVAIAAMPLSLSAQSTNKASAAKPAADKSETAKKSVAGPFHGNLLAVDKVAKTISVGKRTFQITSETKIFKGDGKPATLEDGVVGEPVSGYVKPTPDGKLAATKVTFGAKAAKPAAEKKAGAATATEKAK